LASIIVKKTRAAALCRMQAECGITLAYYTDTCWTISRDTPWSAN